MLTCGWAALALSVACMPASAQPLFAPRGISFGAYAPLGSDVRDFLANPAGLPGIRDWDAEAVMAVPRSGGGAIFEGVALGKRLFDNQAVALQYSPGAELSFVLPSTFRILGLDIATDRKVTYSERFAAAYAISLSPGLSVGLAGRLRTETVSDPQLALQDTTIVSQPNEVGRTSERTPSRRVSCPRRRPLKRLRASSRDT